MKKTKPTGVGKKNAEIHRAHMIDSLINERAGTRDLQDSDFAGDGNEDDDDEMPDHISISSDDDNVAQLPVPLPVPKIAVARSNRTDPPRRNARGTNGVELIERLSGAFDPAVLRVRDENRANRSLQNTQFLTISQQLRDSQANIESLRDQLSDLQGRLHDADRARDRAELKLEMVQMSGMRGRDHSQDHSMRYRSPKPKVKHLCETVYADGGGSRWYVSDGDGDNKYEAQLIKATKAQKRGRPKHSSIRNPFSRHPSRSRSPPHWESTSSRHRGSPIFIRRESPTPPCHRSMYSSKSPPPRPITITSTSPFRSAARGLNDVTLRAAPALNLTTTMAPTMGHSRTSSRPSASVQGDVVSPRRGQQVSFVTSPKQAVKPEHEEPICSQWSVTSRSP